MGKRYSHDIFDESDFPISPAMRGALSNIPARTIEIQLNDQEIKTHLDGWVHQQARPLVAYMKRHVKHVASVSKEAYLG